MFNNDGNRDNSQAERQQFRRIGGSPLREIGGTADIAALVPRQKLLAARRIYLCPQQTTGAVAPWSSLRHQARDLAWSYLDLHLLACLARTAAGSASGWFRIA